MFDRVQYKRMAKRQLKGRWGTPVLVTAVTFFIGIMFELPALIHDTLNSWNTTLLSTSSTFFFHSGFTPSRLSILSVFACYILEVAQLYMYIRMSKSTLQISFNTFLDGLTYWLRAILSALWFHLWVILWTCLFIIPGIVKAISYSQIFYLVADYPHMKIRKAMQISKLITRGHKADLFVMFFSFLGWGILCSLTCGIGLLWLLPYMNMSFTNAYNGIKEDALNRGILTLQDLS